MGYNLPINGIYWGYIPLTNHLLTSWDIQVQPPLVAGLICMAMVTIIAIDTVPANDAMVNSRMRCVTSWHLGIGRRGVQGRCLYMLKRWTWSVGFQEYITGKMKIMMMMMMVMMMMMMPPRKITTHTRHRFPLYTSLWEKHMTTINRITLHTFRSQDLALHVMDPFDRKTTH